MHPDAGQLIIEKGGRVLYDVHGEVYGDVEYG